MKITHADASSYPEIGDLAIGTSLFHTAGVTVPVMAAYSGNYTAKLLFIT